jgi:hypothetical protein
MTPRVLAGYCGRGLAIGIVVTVIGAASPARSARGEGAPQGHVFTVHNESGIARTINVTGGSVMAVDNPFFLDLGINGRRCITCHEPQSNMTVTPARLQARFDATEGTDPIFRPNDGSNSPLADTSTVEARRAAYSMVLTKDLIRIGLPIPVTAEFELVSVRDPYEYAGHNANGDELSLFRRPPPATNLAFLSTVMWDGRETIEKGSPSAIHFDLAHQSNTATQGHAERPAPIDEATRDLIVAYELGLYTAQVFDHAAGGLFAAGARVVRRPCRIGSSSSGSTIPSGAIPRALPAQAAIPTSPPSSSPSTRRGASSAVASATAPGPRWRAARISSTR